MINSQIKACFLIYEIGISVEDEKAELRLK